MNQERQDLKNRLMTQFNVSEEEAEKILDSAQIKNFVNFSNEETALLNQRNIQNDDDLSVPAVLNENSGTKSVEKDNNRILEDTNLKKVNKFSSKQGKILLKKLLNTVGIKIVDDSQIYEESHENNLIDVVVDSDIDSNNVDEILTGIIPDYNQHISVEVNHVDLTFEVNDEKVDTIKESFIRTVKGIPVSKLKIHALKDVSFKIYKGEKIGIIGYNGAGKSTLLNVITGIYSPDKGYVKTRGKISPLLSLGAGFDHNYSGRKNIFLNGAFLGYDREYLESKVDEIIEFSELGEFIDIPIKNYSSGMLAKLGFSIATALEPDILIIDEILGVGDVNFSKKSRDKIRSLMDGGTTVLLVSHSIPQIRELCDKAIWIDNGELREMGEVNKVCDHYLKDSEKASSSQLANIKLRE